MSTEIFIDKCNKDAYNSKWKDLLTQRSLIPVVLQILKLHIPWSVKISQHASYICTFNISKKKTCNPVLLYGWPPINMDCHL